MMSLLLHGDQLVVKRLVNRRLCCHLTHQEIYHKNQNSELKAAKSIRFFSRTQTVSLVGTEPAALPGLMPSSSLCGEAVTSAADGSSVTRTHTAVVL